MSASKDLKSERTLKKPFGINNLRNGVNTVSIWFIKAFIVYNKFDWNSNIVHLVYALKCSALLNVNIKSTASIQI